MELEKVKIEELGKIVTGKTPPTKKQEYYGEKYPFITPTEMNGSDRYVKPDRFLSEEGHQYQSKSLLPKNSTCFVCIGATIGKICLTNEASFTNQQINSIIPNEERVDPKFVYYLLSTKAEEIKSIAGGAATPIVNKSSFSGVEVEIPPKETQKKIASILSAFDDLIENNTRRIAILEEMARLIYREWFVRYRYPGHENDKLVDSGTELGEVPEGWGVKKLNEFGRIETGKTPPKKDPDNYGDYMPFIKTPDMHDQLFIHDSNEFLSKKGTETQKNKTLPPDSLIVNCIGAGAGVVSITTKSSHTNQQINAIILDDLKVREFLYLSLVELRPMLRSIGSAGATMINVSKGKFQALEIVWPGVELIEKFYEKVAPMFDQIKILQKQNLKLKETRDLLLPKLISGELIIH